jgi:transcriptional regulator with XRE-family HTH domain
MTGVKSLNQELSKFLIQQCKKRKLSSRKLSINAGLSPGTVHNIIADKNRPSVVSLNAIADYLGFKREYLWQLGGLFEDMDYSTEMTFSDPQIKYYFVQVDKLPRKRRLLILNVIEALLKSFKAEDEKNQSE